MPLRQQSNFNKALIFTPITRNCHLSRFFLTVGQGYGNFAPYEIPTTGQTHNTGNYLGIPCDKKKQALACALKMNT
jgi:hypothetical protein